MNIRKVNVRTLQGKQEKLVYRMFKRNGHSNINYEHGPSTNYYQCVIRRTSKGRLIMQFTHTEVPTPWLEIENKTREHLEEMWNWWQTGAGLSLE